MINGLLRVRLLIPESYSLKEKRNVLHSISEKVRRKYNVSIAEMDRNEIWNEAILVCAHISNSSQFTNRYLSEVLSFFEKNSYDFLILEYKIEFI